MTAPSARSRVATGARDTSVSDADTGCDSSAHGNKKALIDPRMSDHTVCMRRDDAPGCAFCHPEHHAMHHDDAQHCRLWSILRPPSFAWRRLGEGSGSLTHDKETVLSAATPTENDASSMVLSSPFGSASLPRFLQSLELPESSRPGGGGAAPSQHIDPNTELDKISSSTLNTRRIRDFDDNLGSEAVGVSSLLDLIESADAFCSLINAELSHTIRRSPGIAQQNTERLVRWGIANPCKQHEAVTTCSAFLVLKKNGLARFILNCRPINNVQQSPPDMRLPKVHDLFATLLEQPEGACIATVDATSFFYQHRLCPDVARFFAFATNRQRGHPNFYTMDRMPMGWSMAPAIAQRVSLTLCAETLRRWRMHGGVATDTVTVWLDNFIFASRNVHQLVALFQIVAAEAEVALHEAEFQDEHCELEVLGLTVSMRRRDLAHPLKWRNKVTERFDRATTCREWTQVIGAIVWSHYIRRSALAHTPWMLDIVRRVMKTTATEESKEALARWDRDFCVTNDERTLLWDELTALEGCFTIDRLADAVPVQSDATLQLMAWCSGTHSAMMESQDGKSIFYDGLTAAAMALIEIAAAGAQSAQLFVDNTGVAYAMRSAHSHTQRADRIMDAMLRVLPSSFTYGVSWIPTHANDADKYTRGTATADGTIAQPCGSVSWFGLEGKKTGSSSTQKTILYE